MKEIINFLRTIKDINSMLKITSKSKEKYIIKFIIGNTSCDMDSFTSSVVLSYLRNVQSKFIHVNKNEELTYLVDINKDVLNTLHIPIINCNKGELFWRLDIKELMERSEIKEEDLFYFNEEIKYDSVTNKLIWKTLPEDGNITYQVILVDHHKLDESQKFLSSYVTEILDHHDDTGFDYNTEYPKLMSKTVEFPLGSTMTLINSEFLKNKDLIDNHDSFFKDNYFDFLISAVVLDSNNFSDQYYETRWVRKDKEYAAKIVNSFRKSIFSNIIEEIQFMNDLDFEHFDRLYNILSSVKYSQEKNLELGINALINKDRKDSIIKSKTNSLKIAFSTLSVEVPMIIQKYTIKELCDVIEENSKDKSIDIFIFFQTTQYC